MSSCCCVCEDLTSSFVCMFVPTQRTNGLLRLRRVPVCGVRFWIYLLQSERPRPPSRHTRRLIQTHFQPSGVFLSPSCPPAGSTPPDFKRAALGAGARSLFDCVHAGNRKTHWTHYKIRQPQKCEMMFCGSRPDQTEDFSWNWRPACFVRKSVKSGCDWMPFPSLPNPSALCPSFRQCFHPTSVFVTPLILVLLEPDGLLWSQAVDDSHVLLLWNDPHSVFIGHEDCWRHNLQHSHMKVSDLIPNISNNVYFF